MANGQVVQNPAQESILATNKLIKNTYMLLSMTVFFSAVMAVISMALRMPMMTYLVCLGIAFVSMIFVMPKIANSSKGLVGIFAITGLLGFGIGPVINHYLAAANGPNIVFTAMAGTGIIFVTLSAYALMSRKNFSFMGGFLLVGFVAVLAAALANVFLGMPALSMAISAIVIMLMSGFILYDTSQMIHSPEQTNYIMMTVSLYMSIFNIFIHLLHLLGIGGND